MKNRLIRVSIPLITAIFIGIFIMPGAASASDYRITHASYVDSNLFNSYVLGTDLSTVAYGDCTLRDDNITNVLIGIPDAFGWSKVIWYADTTTMDTSSTNDTWRLTLSFLRSDGSTVATTPQLSGATMTRANQQYFATAETWVQFASANPKLLSRRRQRPVEVQLLKRLPAMILATFRDNKGGDRKTSAGLIEHPHKDQVLRGLFASASNG